MGLVVGLWPAAAAVRIGREEAERLARLGVTRATLVSGERMIGVVVEGWAFDPLQSGTRALDILCSTPTPTSLLPQADVGVALIGKGETDAEATS